MSTYICKCGMTFDKNTSAATTGNRMPDYGPEHECFGCPFVCKVTTWDPIMQQNAVQNHECRASKTLQYDTQAALSLGDKCVGRIYSLDLEFLHQVRDYADSLEGIDPDRYAFSDRPADYGDDGRFKLTIYPAQNNKGIAAKQTIFDKFFSPDGSRKDVTSEQEKEIVLKQIEKAKEEAKSMNTPDSAAQTQQEVTTDNDSFVGTRYSHGGMVYRVGPCGDGKFRTFFHFAVDPSAESVYSNIPKCDTPEVAQKMLDDYAAKHEYEVFSAQEGETEKPIIPEQSSDYIPADAAGESESSDAGEQEQDKTAESDNENADSDNNTDGSENDMEESQDGPCGWKNASGADDDEEEPEKPENDIPAGERVSLQDNAFSALIAACDEKINRALRTSVDAGQGFTFTAKVTFEPRGNVFGVKYETGYQFDPIKVKDKGELYEEIQIALDDAGNPIIPYNRQHQINFDELQPGRLIPPAPVKTTVDGNTGLVESVATEDSEDELEDPPTSDDTTNEVVGADLQDDYKEQLSPCDHYDCPFYAVPDDGKPGCCFDPGAEDAGDPSIVGNVWTAVNMESCQRQEVMESYRKNNPEEDYDDGDEVPRELEFTEEEYAS